MALCYFEGGERISTNFQELHLEEKGIISSPKTEWSQSQLKASYIFVVTVLEWLEIDAFAFQQIQVLL